MSRDRIIQSAFRELDRSLRKTSIAQIGGFRPSELPIASWFGGRFVGLPGESWPRHGEELMLPLLQVRIDELPHVPWQLQNIALFSVFIGPRQLPLDLPATSGNGWLIRTYNSLDGLMPLAGEPTSHLKPFPIRWSLAERDAPGWYDAAEIANLSKFSRLDDGIDQFHDRYARCSTTKVGGWPSYIQGAPGESADYFAFQIASEEKSNWMWGDNGNAYFYYRGEWVMHWDCY